MARTARIFRYTLPLCQPLHLRGQVITERTGLLLCLEEDSGATGWGEAAPLPGFSREILLDARADLQFGAEMWIEGTTPAESACPSADFALRAAVANLHPAENTSTSLTVNALLSGNQADILARAGELHAQGYRAAKLKVGTTAPDADAELTRAVRATLHPDVRLRLDANRAWTWAQALRFAERIEDCAIEYIEEPLDDPAQLLEWREKTALPYALDETLQEATWKPPHDREKLQPLFQQAAAWVWKPTLAHESLVQALQSTGANPPIILSAAHESGVGIAAIARLAARYSGPDTPVGLDTYRGLTADVLQEPLPMLGAGVRLEPVLTSARRVDTARLALLWRQGA